MDQLDIPALADRIREHRFDGYTDNMLADEIDRFRAGQGAGGLSGAVDALIAVGEALAKTEQTLRTELGKLGVEWQSEAAARAGSAVAGQADFSGEARERVNDSAERIFAQGEAFNRTLHKLPDSQTLREGGTLGLLDSVSSLLGFETDNTRRANAAREARLQALDALNDYATDSGQNLMGMHELESPQAVQASMSPRVPGSVDAGGGPRDVTTTAGTTAAPASAPAPSPIAPQPAPGSSYAPTPPLGMPAQAPARATGSVASAPGAVPQTTAPSSSTAPSTSAAAAAGVTGVAGARQAPRQTGAAAPSSPVTGTGTTPGTPATPGTGTGTGTPGVPGATAVPGPGGTTNRAPGSAVPGPGVPGKTGGVSGVGTPGAPGTTGTPGTGGTAGAPPAAGVVGGKPAVPGQGAQNEAQPLAKGKTFGSAPQPSPVPGTATGGGYVAAARAGASATDLGAGAAALGAGGVAGALSGDNERKGRGVGRSAPGAARSPHQLAVGDLPEEEARAQRNSERLGGGSEQRNRSYLEKAAPQEEDDLGHVRRYGVDDNDLFTDQRMVSPDVIGDDDADGRR